MQGLTSHDALQKLHGDLWAEVKVYQGKTKTSTLLEKWRSSSFHHTCRKSAFHWTNAVVLVLLCLGLFVSYGLNLYRSPWLLVEGVVLLVILGINLYFNQWDHRLREDEMLQKTKCVLQKIRECIKRDIWTSSHYINLHSPISQCVQLQWTVRDGDVVSLPVNLLVEGDLIYLRPGQTVHGRCREVQQYDLDREPVTLNLSDIYQPEESRSESESIQYGVTGKKPVQPAPFVMLETPFVHNIRGILDKASSRPCSLLTNERYDSYNIWVERRIIPTLLILGLFFNTLRFVFLKSDIGHWSELFLTLQVQCIFPLSALVFPVMYKLLELFGNAKVYTAFLQDLDEKPSAATNYSEQEVSVQKDLATPIDREKLYKNFKKILLGESGCLPRTTSLLQTLGNVTEPSIIRSKSCSVPTYSDNSGSTVDTCFMLPHSFCCVDKKGVLSWPNPTAEKVFFLRNAELRKKDSVVTEESTVTHSSRASDHRDKPASCYKKSLKHDVFTTDCDFEVLDMTQDPKNGYGLNFDDKSWKKHLNSLKPFGLNILLNTCNIDTAQSYTEFADHVTCEALEREDAIPVVNRRCFCELSKQIGFSDKASEIFDLQQVLGLYRHLSRPVDEKETSVQRSKSFIKYKMPMPNTFSVVVKEKATGMSQLFSQGTGDLLLDACSDYWDGHDVCSLSSMERKKISDFYHRTSMASYCTAFAYKPMTESLSAEVNQYIEVADNNTTNVFTSGSSPTSKAKNRTWGRDCAGTSSTPHPQTYHGSADSLMCGSSLVSVHELSQCFDAQCNQIFIGMISMQYQAKQDIVQLIEDLDNACIRFVHFSKENELRSRVFSEKMGLEAGWNCHISLLSNSAHTASPSQQDLSQSEASKGVSHFSSHQSILDQHKVTGDSPQVLIQDPLQRCLSAPGAISGTPGGGLDSYRDLLRDSRGMLDYLGQQQEVDEGGQDEMRADDGIYVKDPPIGSALIVEDSSDHVHFDINEPLLLRHSRQQQHHQYESVKRQILLQNQVDTASSHDSTISVFDDGPPPTKMAAETQMYQVEKEKTGFHVKRDGSKTHVTLDTEDSSRDPLLKEDVELVPMRYSSTGGRKSQNINSHNNLKDERQSYDPNDSLESYPPSSYITENTDSVAGLGLLNRAKLPRGIENIRPHIENVDNVPLLVSLFTDCVPETTQEMLQILQEYGEVVCCFGSSSDARNTDIFLQADCSLGVEPLYPQLCVKYPVIPSRWQEGDPTPTELSVWLNTLPSALAFERADHFRLLHLVAIARHHCSLLRNTFLVLLMLECCLTSVMFISQLMLLPPPLASHHLMWLAIVVAPLLSLCMMGAEADGDIVKMAQGKNVRQLAKRNVIEFLVYYLLRFIPSVLICLLLHALTLTSLCQHFVLISNRPVSNHSVHCHPLMGDINFNQSSTWNGWYTDYRAGLVLSQNFVALQLLLVAICTSLCLMYRRHHLWQRSPFYNTHWVLISLSLILVQILYFAVDVTVAVKSHDTLPIHISLVPVPVWVLTFVWPPVTAMIHELTKRREIKMSVRYHKRARLDFGTKLGMNSPF